MSRNGWITTNTRIETNNKERKAEKTGKAPLPLPYIFLGASSGVKNGLSGSPAATTSIAAVPLGAATSLLPLVDASGRLLSSHAEAASLPPPTGVPLREGGVAEPDSVFA